MKSKEKIVIKVVIFIVWVVLILLLEDAFKSYTSSILHLMKDMDSLEGKIVGGVSMRTSRDSFISLLIANIIYSPVAFHFLAKRI